jgi:hypothetical protein
MPPKRMMPTRLPFNLLDVLDLGARHNVVIERVRLREEKRELDAVRHRLQRRDRRAEIEIDVAVDQRADRRGTAGE